MRVCASEPAYNVPDKTLLLIAFISGYKCKVNENLIKYSTFYTKKIDLTISFGKEQRFYEDC